MPITVSPSASSASRAELISAMGSRAADDGTHCAKTPSGMLREDSVHATHCTDAGSAVVTARASVVFPTPAGPVNTMPPLSAAVSAARIPARSSLRSSNCQVLLMPEL